MRINEIIEEIEMGVLKVGKYEYKDATRSKRIYHPKDTIGEWIEYPEYRKGKIEMIRKWYGDFIKWEQQPFKKVRYFAEYKDGRQYKINKAIYEKYNEKTN